MASRAPSYLSMPDPYALAFARERLGSTALLFKMLAVGQRFRFNPSSPVMTKRSDTGWYADPTHPKKKCYRTGVSTGVIPVDD